MMLLVSYNPIMIQGSSLQAYSSSDKNPYMYNNLKAFIEKHELQIGDDISECIRRSVLSIEPVRPEQTEEQKKIKPRGMFST